jgi:hypothetical protein
MPETLEGFERSMRGYAKASAAEGWSETEIVQALANGWNRMRQNDAMDVLFAYGSLEMK